MTDTLSKLAQDMRDAAANQPFKNILAGLIEFADRLDALAAQQGKGVDTPGNRE